MTSGRVDVALVVLNWNGADLLRRHMPAVMQAAAGGRASTRVYVIDNDSEDDSRAVVAGMEGVELIARPGNRKLHAYNDVLPQIDCEAFLMLNNDVSPAPGVVDRLWDVLRADESVFAVGGEVLDTASGELDSGPTAARWEQAWVLEPTALAGATAPVDVAYVSGGAGMYRREMFLALGGFWELLPGLYWEDVELGLHAWVRGWRSVFHPGAHFDHASGSTVRRALNPYRREFRTYQNIRLIHLSLLLDGADLRDWLRGELRRSLRKPYYYPAALTLLPRVPAALRRRRSLRAAHGAPTVADLQQRWRPAD
jgi:GT2 family glycosyltransferase